MSKLSKILIASAVIIAIILSIYAFKITKERGSFENENTSKTENIEQTQNNQDVNTETSTSQPITDNSAVNSIDAASDENTPDESNNFLDVTKADCGNSCKDFTDPEDLKYCQQICGLTPISKEVKEAKGCDKLDGLEKDYCLKDLAISTQNIQSCNEISDTDVKKVCRNRIAQDMIEKQIP